jgi:signal transduction histidine kinase
MGCLPIFTYVFPDGHFVPRWTRMLTLFWIVWLVLAPFTPFAIGDFAGPSALWFGVLLPGGMAIGILAQVYRYRRVSTRLEQQQVKWVLFGFGVVALGIFLYSLVPLVFPSVLVPGLPKLLFELLGGPVLIVLPLCLLPLCIGIAILRYRLWDIDHLINRTLVYGALSAGVAGLYIVLVVALGALFARGEALRGNVVIGLLATGTVAFLIQPLRERLQQSVNRLMYGERDDPYAVLSRLGERLEATIAPDAVLPAIVQTINDALKLPYVAIALTTDDGRWTTEHQPPSTDEAVEGDWRFVVAEAGTRAEIALALPLVFRHETVGHLLLAPRAPNEAFSPADHRLLHDLARQAGIAVHAVQLTRDLQRSRERLVTAREEERRRLRRDLHDGLGPTLASLTMKLETAEVLVAQDLHGGVALLHEIQGQMKATIGNVRRLVYALRPPVLDQFGLIGALREHALQLQGQALANSDRNGDDRCAVHITIDAPDQLPSLPAAVEVAAYYIAVEAMTNVARHAQARQCCVRVVVGGGLMLTIEDDGCGLPTEVRAGVGLHSMRERAAELGGSWMIERIPPHGTRVCAMLPLES